MKKRVLLLCALLAMAVVVPTAQAAGVNLAWGTLCWSERNVSTNLTTFACNTNSTTTKWNMTMSFAVATEITDYVGFETYIDGASQTGTIPDWWLMGASGDCRYATGIFSTTCPDYTAITGYGVVCQDVFAGTGQGGGGIALNIDGKLILQGVYAIGSPGVDLLPDLETYANTFTIKNSKSVGTGACAGCATPICFVLSLTNAAGITSTQHLTNAITGGNQCLYWQQEFTGPFAACNGTPTKNATWGQIKTLYR